MSLLAFFRVILWFLILRLALYISEILDSIKKMLHASFALGNILNDPVCRAFEYTPLLFRDTLKLIKRIIKVLTV